MRKISIEKIVLNIGCGKDGKIQDAKKILERFTKSKVVVTKTHKRSTFGLPKGKEIGCKVTIRKKTTDVLKTLFLAKENMLSLKSFDRYGNFSFGIKEYIDIPTMEYDPTIGVMGFDVCVSLKRPGFSVSKKMLASKIGKKHKITREDAIEFVKKNFAVQIE